MNVLFRLNAGKKNGLGHLTRNIYLSDELRSRNLKTQFLIKADKTIFIKNFISKKKVNLNVRYINQYITVEDELAIIDEICNLENIKIVIIDHYDHTIRYLRSIKKNNVILVNYDINKKRNYVSDLIINPNFGFNKNDYNEKVKDYARLCIGEKYLIINPMINNKKFNKTKKENILISFGGGKYPKKIVNLIDKITENKHQKFIIISSDYEISQIKKRNTKVYFGNLDYSKIFSSLKFAIVSGGVTSQELAYLRIPMLIYPYSKNHKISTTGLINHRLAVKATTHQLLNLNNFETKRFYHKFKIDNKGIKRISKKISMAFISEYNIDGERLILRPLKEKDTSSILKWRNDIDIRKWMINQDIISRESHLNWFKSKRNRFDFIIEEKVTNKPIGTLNLKLKSNSEAELGKLIGEKQFLGKGYAKESFKLLVSFAFRNLYLKKLFIHTKVNNEKNIMLNKKLGFKIEKELVINSSKVYKMSLQNNE